MALKIYNTATRQKEDFVPLNPPQVMMYNCGPTVYDYFHVGNARNFVVVDTIRRYMEARGYEVKFVQNFTDIDDKIINRANENNEAWDALAKRFTEAYFKNADMLGVRRATIHPLATEHIEEMQDIIAALISKGLAYQLEGDVYFRVRALPTYGSLSGRRLDDMKEGARVEVDDNKEDPMDFALWKSAKPGEPFWESPWGNGRPGWHIECSAMSMKHLGKTIDIHSGGTDLVFPHHENECAQSIGVTGQPLARYWVHNGFLTINAEKMSKSLGNFFTIDEVLKHFPASAVRFFLLSAQYRHPLDYNDGALREAENATGRIREALVTSEKILKMAPHAAADAAAGEKFYADFTEVMDDDFNTQGAIGVVFETVTALNDARAALSRDINAPDKAARTAGLLETLRKMLDILGLLDLLTKSQGADDAAGDDAAMGKLLDLLVTVRADAKKAKQFAIADKIRDELAAMGIRLQDHPTGTIWIRDDSAK